MARTRAWRAFAGILAGLALLAAGCGGSNQAQSPAPAGQGAQPSQPAEKPPLRIGVIQPFSGPLGFYGEEVFRGVEMATADRNAKGGVLGRKIVLVKGDAQDAATAVSEAERLITKEKVDLVTGSYSSAISYAASEVAASHNKIWWETNAIAPNITQRGLMNIARAGPSSVVFARQTIATLVEVVAPALKVKPSELRLAVTHEDSIYGTSVADIVWAEAGKAGIQTVIRSAHKLSATDLTDEILKLKNANPDVWVAVTYNPDGILSLRTARNLKWLPKAVVWVGVGDNPEFLNALTAKGLENILVVGYTPYNVNPKFAPGVTDILKKYQDTYKEDPRAPQSLQSYAATLSLFEVLEKMGGTDPDAMRKTLMSLDIPLNTYPNGGGLKMDPGTQDNLRAGLVTKQWQEGKLPVVYPANAASEGAQVRGLPLAGWDQR